MKHARPDYQRIQDPAGLIPEDEPVFLLRGQDPVAGAAVRHWAWCARVAGAHQDIFSAAERQAEAMEAWSRDRASHVPDLPAEGTCPGFEVEPGVYSGCTAAAPGEGDCPACGDLSGDCDGEVSDDPEETLDLPEDALPAAGEPPPRYLWRWFDAYAVAETADAAWLLLVDRLGEPGEDGGTAELMAEPARRRMHTAPPEDVLPVDPRSFLHLVPLDDEVEFSTYDVPEEVVPGGGLLAGDLPSPVTTFGRAAAWEWARVLPVGFCVDLWQG